MKSLLAGVTLLALPLAGTTASPQPHSSQTEAKPGRFAVDLGRHSFKVTTTLPAAQRAFDRGLTLAYSFAHEAAMDEFRRATAADPKLAMAWWGIALVNGPHINFPMVPPDRAQAAWEALTKAQSLASNASAVERALIEALSKRYANPAPDDRGPLDGAYADALREVWRQFPRHPDVGALLAEALMDLHPWDLWTGDGQPQPWTAEIVSTLKRVLKLDPQHPGGNHLYVHALEASPHPERALAAANRLRHLVPGASHMVHMPAHIDARVGHWREAAAANVKAMQADGVYRAAHPRPGFYAMYMAHNAHFLAYTEMMRGRSAEALRAAHLMVDGIPPEFLDRFAAVADGFMIFVSEVLMRFGRWEEMLAEPAPRKDLPLSTALWHFTRGVALTALNRLDEARTEQAAFAAATAAVPKESSFGNNPSTQILTIATSVLAGEMAAKVGHLDEAIANLQAAVQVEDGLRYDEPPDWIQPARHTLGAVLLRSGRAVEAEAVYREDLRRYPENGWSLYGLSRALRKQGRQAEAVAVERRFRRAWKDADVTLGSTCFCQPAD